MTRRILLVLVVFTAVLITGAMVPLALNTTAHERNAFTQDVEGMVRTDAAVAQVAPGVGRPERFQGESVCPAGHHPQRGTAER